MKLLMGLPLAGLAAIASAQAPDRPIWQLPSGEIVFRDYPSEVGPASISGKVEFRATTGADGTLQSCQITKTSGYPSLDRESCRLLTMYAKFKPVRMKDGYQTVTGVVKWSPMDAAALAANRIPVSAGVEEEEKKPPTPRFGWKKKPVPADRLIQ